MKQVKETTLTSILKESLTSDLHIENNRTISQHKNLSIIRINRMFIKDNNIKTLIAISHILVKRINKFSNKIINLLIKFKAIIPNFKSSLLRKSKLGKVINTNPTLVIK
jgi:hypothetical protein